VLNAAYAKPLFAYKRINAGDARFGFVAVPMPYTVPTLYKLEKLDICLTAARISFFVLAPQ
jgi:hypothetical protein